MNIFRRLSILIGLAVFCSCSNMHDVEEEAVVKIAIRSVGNQLLLAHQDSTSLVLPVELIGLSKYELSFAKELSMAPDSIVAIVKRSFNASSLAPYYRVELIQCSDDEVAYSYEIKNDAERDIIPCANRFLPEKCYTIEIKFTDGQGVLTKNSYWLYALIIILISILGYVLYKQKEKELTPSTNHNYTAIGSYHFYPSQNKLVKAAKEISLSKKECELLALLVARPNEIITRDELTKRVWEDNGVFVGRSLDTYISKLRKILKDDDRIKLTNVHGVGYKLEVS